MRHGCSDRPGDEGGQSFFWLPQSGGLVKYTVFRVPELVDLTSSG